MWPHDGTGEKAETPAKYCARLERLIHLELADLARHKAYASPEFPDSLTPPARSASPIEKCVCQCEYDRISRSYQVVLEYIYRWCGTQGDIFLQAILQERIRRCRIRIYGAGSDRKVGKFRGEVCRKGLGMVHNARVRVYIPMFSTRTACYP